MPPNNQTVRMAPVGQALPMISPFYGWLPRELWGLEKDFFIYTANFLPLAISATATTDIAIQSDSDFVIVACVQLVLTDADAGPALQPLATVTLLDAGSGRQLMDRAVAVENLYGTAQRPAYLPMPKLIKRASTFSTTLTNLEATARNYRLSYWGFKIFGYPQQ